MLLELPLNRRWGGCPISEYCSGKFRFLMFDFIELLGELYDRCLGLQTASIQAKRPYGIEGSEYMHNTQNATRNRRYNK